MPFRRSNNVEKAPMDEGDFGGLQLDTRAKENKGLFLDQPKTQGFLHDDLDDHTKYTNEKQARKGSGSHLGSLQIPIEDGLSPVSPPLPKPGRSAIASTSAPLYSGNGRICGLRRRFFWTSLGLVLALIIVAAIVGGIVGGLQARNASIPPVHSQYYSANGTLMTPFVRGDVLADSPINVISYDSGGSGSPDSRQIFRVYYQSISGNVTEAVSNGMTTWQTARPIFTDALNYTGLAAFSYLNGSQRQGSIFYAGSNGLLQEKRKILDSEAYWMPGTLNSLNLPMVGNISLPLVGTDPPNRVDSFRMAAVYSANFKSGPGARLFYHVLDLNGTTYVQELIWIQAQDTWYKGAQIRGPWPNSHLAATVDETTKVLRLFFSAGNNTLQEVWGDISKSPMDYSSGNVNLTNFLAYNSADIAAVSSNGTTSLFYYAVSAQSTQTGIHELTITGKPGSQSNPEAFTPSEPFVYNPSLTILGAPANQNQFPYLPLAAGKTAVAGLEPQILTFWAQNITGDPLKISGYRQLAQMSRLASNPVWPSTPPMQIPLAPSP